MVEMVDTCNRGGRRTVGMCAIYSPQKLHHIADWRCVCVERLHTQGVARAHLQPERISCMRKRTSAETFAPPARTHAHTCAHARAFSYCHSSFSVALTSCVSPALALSLSLSDSAGSLACSLASRFVCRSVIAFPPSNILHPTCTQAAMT
uniref:WGS project CAFE00000000 data, contig n=1 Tax=Taenia asiatica TaxID=60517 RepID=A0A0R3W8Y7_TAEAS